MAVRARLQHLDGCTCTFYRQEPAPYTYVVELVHNVTEEHLPPARPVRDEHGNLRRLVKEEDVLRKVGGRTQKGGRTQGILMVEDVLRKVG